MPKSIIDLVRELQRLWKVAGEKNTQMPVSDEKVEFLTSIIDHFPAIAQALLDRDAKLRIAVEVIQQIANGTNDETAHQLCHEALSRLLPLE